ncbi:TrkA C-terminal domain-containing protein [Roseateles sp.]|uniref:aspartate-alanine antiporter-like transporter n=1 Tax=Roseateles sp. TaxID=1971397 RepID=UPI0031E04DC6
MNWISHFLTAQPLLALFLTIAIGYWLGSDSVRGFALGSGAVLFVGLAVGALVPTLTLPPLLGNLGLMLFLYGVGIAYGAQFLRGLSSKEGMKANAAALIAVLAALGLMLAAVAWWPGMELSKALGAYAGAGDRSELDYGRFFVSSPAVAGKRMADLQLPPELKARILHLRRSDTDLPPHEDRLFEFGDRVGVLAPRESFAALGRLFGDSVRGTGEISYIGLGVGVTLGLALGAIAWPLPLLGHFSLGFAGLLLVALLLGWRRRSGPLQWAMPISANLVLRNFGLTVFLAVVGISSGATFAATVTHSGWMYLLLGSAIVAVLVAVTLLIAMAVFRLPFDTAAGVVAGATGNPAILGFANRIAPTDKPDIGYAMIFPSMTVVKILLVQAVALWGGTT